MGNKDKQQHAQSFARAVAPLFFLTVPIHFVAVVSRFDAIALLVPSSIETTLLLIHFPLILIEAFVVSQLLAGKKSDFPLWMQIDAWSVRASITLAFTYLSIVALQFWNLEFGIINPHPPASWPLWTRLKFFLMMSVGMGFSNYLAATKIFLPVLRVLTAPARWLPGFLALIVLAAVGLVLGEVSLRVLVDHGVGEQLGTLQSALNGGAMGVVTLLAGSLASTILAGIKVLADNRSSSK